MIKRLTILLLLCILLPSLLLAAEQAAAPGMVIRADSMSHDLASDTIKADGKVEMTWQDMTMTADHATFNRTTHTLTATGNVHLLKAGDTLSGDQLVMDTETGRAEMENGRIFMTQGNFRADGKQIARLGESDYALRSGGLTTCDAATPSWKFGASELDVTLEEFATGKNVVFYVKDIPVFYFPYLILPVKRERQSGLLFPRFGNSSKRGCSLISRFTGPFPNPRRPPLIWTYRPSGASAWGLTTATCAAAPVKVLSAAI
jgi:LPS-assembly protein